MKVYTRHIVVVLDLGAIALYHFGLAVLDMK